MNSGDGALDTFVSFMDERAGGKSSDWKYFDVSEISIYVFLLQLQYSKVNNAELAHRSFSLLDGLVSERVPHIYFSRLFTAYVRSAELLKKNNEKVEEIRNFLPNSSLKYAPSIALHMKKNCNRMLGEQAAKQ